MIKCNKCNKRMFLDRQYSSAMHLEIYCMFCGTRRFFHPPQDSIEGSWLLKREQLRTKITITPL